MHSQIKRYLQLLLIVLDYLLLNISFFVTLYLFHGRIGFDMLDPFLRYWAFLNISWALLSFVLGGYGENIIIDFESFTKRTTQVYIVWILFILSYLFILGKSEFSRSFIIITVANFGVVLLFNRFLYFGIKHYLKIQNHLINKVLILGFNDTAKKMAGYFEEEGLNTQLVGFIEDEKNIKELSNYPVLDEIKNTMKIVKEYGVQEIFSTIAPEQNKYIYKLMNEAEKKCIRFKIVPNLSVFFRKPVIIDYIKDMPVLSMRSDPMEDIKNRMIKRLLDVVISFLVVVFILSWMIPLLGLLIIIESRGPILFAQLRTGRNDKSFYCLKFRSMRMNKESESKQAIKNDSRVTKIGAFMRKTSLDEFPQFINVLKGDMSLVGPRPHMIKHTNDFSKMVNHYMARQFLKPGITGWAQINSFRGEIIDPIQLKMRVASDLWYLENWNIWLDLRIIFLTVYQVFAGDKHAY
jgi:putative colanic acid biosynthesis UDP-glucose lipid carrier transferase